MKKEENTFLKYYLPNILFNLIELATIFCIGIIFVVDVKYVACIFVAFILNKIIFGKSMHYKDWYICFGWSTLLFISFYLLSYISIELACLFTTGFVFLSENANIKEINHLFMWKNTKNVPSKYHDIEEYIKFNEFNPKLIKFEENLKMQDNQLYLIYKYRFKGKLSFNEISKRLDYYPTQRITEKLDGIALSIRMLKDL